MGYNIIRFPKNVATENFYRFIVRWSDGVEFTGSSVDECFRKQKDVFEPEITMDEYLNRFKKRLRTVTGKEYLFETIPELINILEDLGFIEVEWSER